MPRKITLSAETVDGIILDGLKEYRSMSKKAIKDILKIKKKREIDLIDLASEQSYLDALEVVISQHSPPR